MKTLFKLLNKKRAVYMRLLLAVCMVITALAVLPQQSAYAATIIWDGGHPSSNYWTDVLNWSTDAIPTVIDDVLFNSTSTKNSVINSSPGYSYLLYGFLIDTGYTGSISFTDGVGLIVRGNFTINDGTFTAGTAPIIITGNLTVGGGAFVGSAANIEVHGQLIISGGSFTAPSGVLEIWGGINQTGGTFTPNGGTVLLNPPSNQTLTLGASTAFYNLTLNDGLIGYWGFDNDGNDSSPSGNNTGFTGTAAYSTNHTTTSFNNTHSLALDGTYYASVPNQGHFHLGTSFSLATWVYLNNTGSAAYILTKGNSWQLVRPGWTNSVQCVTEHQGSGTNTLTTITALSTGQWYHLACVFTGTEKRLYLNGGLEASVPISDPLATTNNAVGMGALMNGMIDDARIYDRPLSAGEITTLWNGNPLGDSVQVTVAGVTDLTVNHDLRIKRASLVLPTGGNLLVSGFTEHTRALNGSGSEIPFAEVRDGAGAVRYRGIGISTTDNLGDMSVIVKDLGTGEYCTMNDGGSPNYTRRCFNIVRNGSGAMTGATVYLYARDLDQLNGIAVADLLVYHYNGTAWVALGGSGIGMRGGTGYVVYDYAYGLTTGFSSFLLGGPDAPTAVNLVKLSAHPSAQLTLGLLLMLLLAISILLFLLHRRKTA